MSKIEYQVFPSDSPIYYPDSESAKEAMLNTAKEWIDNWIDEQNKEG